MQFDEGNRIRERWIAAGRPECDPHQLEREYLMGANSGDKRCRNCGATFFNGEDMSDK